MINSEEALQAGDLNLVPDTTTTTVNSSLSAEENIVIIDTTTTTVIKNIPEEDGVIEDKQIIGQSDGASITPTDMAIFQSEEDSAILNSLNNTDINEGCLNKSNEEVRKEQWQIFSSLNTYKENSLNINLKIENSLNMDIDCLATSFRDVAVGVKEFNEFKSKDSKWKEPNEDKLIMGVINQVCDFWEAQNNA